MEIVVSNTNQIRNSLHEHLMMNDPEANNMALGISHSMAITGEAVLPYWEGGQPKAIRFVSSELHQSRTTPPPRRSRR